LARAVVDDLFDSGGCIWSALATTVLVEALLQRGGDADLEDARAATDCLAAAPTDDGLALRCCDCGLYWRGLTVTRPAIANSGIATATQRNPLASEDISSGPRKCHDGGYPGRAAHAVSDQTTYESLTNPCRPISSTLTAVWLRLCASIPMTSWNTSPSIVGWHGPVDRISQ
jgi:hypothetical protein